MHLYARGLAHFPDALFESPSSNPNYMVILCSDNKQIIHEKERVKAEKIK